MMTSFLPFPLSGGVLACLLVPVTVSIPVSAGEFIVDAAQASDAIHHIYNTLEELASSGLLVSGDTIVLNNDDSSLTAGLTIPVNFSSDDSDAPRTVDLSGLGDDPLYNLTEGSCTMDMNSIIWARAMGRVIEVEDRNVSLKITGHVQFLNNTAPSEAGGAICMYGDNVTLTFENNAVFSGNHVSESNPNVHSCHGGAIYMEAGRDTAALALGTNTIFSGNYVSNSHSGATSCYGGAIYMYGRNASILSLGANATFLGNYVTGNTYSHGGAICMYGLRSLSFTIRDGAIFKNNYAGTFGGAIYLQGMTYNADTISRFLAFTHDVLFSGNMTGGTVTQLSGGITVENGIANAIHVSGGNHLQLAAAREREVRFNDPVTSDGRAKELIFSLNRYTDDEGNSHITEGTVIFSGEHYQGGDAHLVASRYNDFKGQVTLYGGTLVLEHNVVFGNSELKEDTSMTLERGTLEITGGSTVNAASFTVAHGGVILRPGTSSFINAKNVDFSQGFVFDMQKQIHSAGSPVSPSGLSISASDSFIMGGSIGIMDSGVSADYFYADNSWAQERTFIVLTDSDRTHVNDFLGACSIATGSERVDSPYAYTGSWSHQWLDADGDGFAEQLQLVWTPASSSIRGILPELAGALTMNSMWSSASNALGMSATALGTLDATRFITGPENNYWVKGMGDFLCQGSEGSRDGFDYNGGGYAVGADRRMAANTVLGLGFGDLYGKMYSRSFVGDIGQQTRIAMFYGGWNKELDRNHALMVTGSAGYGWTGNRMNSCHTGGWSHGKWTNRTLAAALNGKWSRRLNENLSVDFMFGLEYTDVTQGAFTETGWDGRRFGKGHLKNLSLPAGAGITCRSELKGREWINSVAVSYLPDVYRENPDAPAQRLLNGYRWEAKGAAPDRNALRVNLTSSLQLSPRWRVHAGYEFEGRSRATAHRFNAGAAFTY